MTIKILKDIINGLAQSQGSYGRFQKSLDVGDGWERLCNYCNENGIEDAVSLVMDLEG